MRISLHTTILLLGSAAAFTNRPNLGLNILQMWTFFPTDQQLSVILLLVVPDSADLKAHIQPV